MYKTRHRQTSAPVVRLSAVALSLRQVFKDEKLGHVEVFFPIPSYVQNYSKTNVAETVKLILFLQRYIFYSI